MNWRFFINDTSIEEPIGWADLVIKIMRDENWKGVFFQASGSALQFYGDAYDLLFDLKQSYGVDAVAIFRAEQRCEGGSWEEALRGKLNFAQYRERCGTQCFISMPWEQDDCTMIVRNRYDQKVNIGSNIAFNGQTVLQDYEGLNFEMQIPAQQIEAAIEGYVADEGNIVDLMIFPNDERGKQYAVRPDYTRPIKASIKTTQLSPSVQAASDNGLNDSVLSPILLLEDTQGCFDRTMPYEGRIKGSTRFCLEDNDPFGNMASFSLSIIVARGNDVPFGTYTVLHQSVIFDDRVPANCFEFEFDYSFSGTIALNEGEGIFAFLFWDTNNDTAFYNNTRDATFDAETYIKIDSLSNCPPTDAEVSLIHETASRITEAITDLCLKVKSDYYGRTDSEPYAAATDGCGSLRILTNGLRLRNATTDDHFLSLKDVFDSLNAIDNIGMGVEGDWLRIEPIDYFFNNTLLFNIDSVPDSETNIAQERIYAIIKVGYAKWETENTNGLDEFNSNKEFRTMVKSVHNSLDIVSEFIAGGYPIELTRQQSFVETGAADTKYDNDTFIICVVRSASYIPFIVEQGNISNAANFFSPATALNWRIRPMYNLMRWGKSILNAYPNILQTDSKIVFSSGKGNYIAEGELTDPDTCKLEAHVMAENSSVSASDYRDTFTPILSVDDLTFEYPLSVAQYKLIKANPYGYINVQCGNGDYQKAYIQSIDYKISEGTATFNLSKKWT